MKFIVVIIAIIILLFIFKGSSETFEVNQAIFNQVEIPTDKELANDPYYQFIKNKDFPCACGEGKEKNANNECVPLCPPGQTRHTNGICYPPCPPGQTRHTNGICYPPCPVGEFRNPSGVCQCTPQQPLYDLFTNHDISGQDLGGSDNCLRNHAGGVWPAWANEAKARCDSNPECKAYNLISSGGAWGNNWGSCMKITSDSPSRVPLSAKIDYYRKIETSRNNNGVCVTECPVGKTKDANGICQPNPCLPQQTRDAYGVCQWNPCPTGQTRDGNGVCQWPPCPVGQTRFTDNICYPPCPTGQTRHTNKLCYPPCPTGQTRDGNGICQWPPCPANSTVNQTTGNCICNPGYEVGHMTIFNPYLAGQTLVDRRHDQCLLQCAPGVLRDVNLVCGGGSTGVNIDFSGFGMFGN